MLKVSFIDHGGVTRTVEGRDGDTVMEAATRNDVPGINAECGGACACATCHVYVAPEWLDLFAPPTSTEVDMLDFAEDVRANSRLSCQLKLSENLDGVVVYTPESQG